MAKKNRSIGLKNLLWGPIAQDGGMSTTLTELVGNTVRGTASVTSSEITSEQIFEEESDDPIEDTVTGGGVFTWVWSSYNLAPEVLVEALGGTIGADGMWEAPDEIPTIERSLKGESRNGYIVESPRVSIRTTVAINFQKGVPGQLNFVGTILKPDKAGVKKLRAGVPTTP